MTAKTLEQVMALYNAKRAGRNCIRILLAPIDKDSSDNANTSAALSSIHR